MLLDVDFFKNYNDHYGHLMGDDCLNSIVHILKQCKQRHSDFIARFGGEEFIYILPDTSEQGAIQVAKHIIEQINQAQIPHATNPNTPFVTISIGIATFGHDPVTLPETVLQQADVALYKAKTSGKNQYQLYSKPLE